MDEQSGIDAFTVTNYEISDNIPTTTMTTTSYESVRRRSGGKRKRETEKDFGRIMTVKGSWLCHWWQGKPVLLCAIAGLAIVCSPMSAAKKAARIGISGD